MQQDDEALAEELKKARGQITEAVRKAKEDHKRRRDEEKSAAATGGVFAQRPLSRLTKRQSLFRSSRLLSSREPTPAEASNQTALGEILPFSQTGASVPFSVPTTPGSTASAPTTAPTTPAAPASPSPRQTHTSPLPQGPEGYFPTATSSVESLDSPPRSASSSASDPSVLDASTAQTTPDISRPSTLNSEATVSARSMVAKMFAWTRRSRPSK